jgi:hypothetical protein
MIEEGNTRIWRVEREGKLQGKRMEDTGNGKGRLGGGCAWKQET